MTDALPHDGLGVHVESARIGMAQGSVAELISKLNGVLEMLLVRRAAVPSACLSLIADACLSHRHPCRKLQGRNSVAWSRRFSAKLQSPVLPTTFR
jgi:hypothetical protein